MDEEKKAAHRTPAVAALERALVCNRPARHRFFVGLPMISSSTVTAMSAPPVAGGVLKRLRKLLTRPIRLERRGFDFHFVFDKPSREAGGGASDDSAPRRRH